MTAQRLDFRPLRLLQGDLEQPRHLGAQHGVMARGRGSLAAATGDGAAARGEKRGFGIPLRRALLAFARPLVRRRADVTSFRGNARC
jgi:hypothetical protein